MCCCLSLEITNQNILTNTLYLLLCLFIECIALILPQSTFLTQQVANGGKRHGKFADMVTDNTNSTVVHSPTIY